ncbi:DUF2341 domain-containing protein [Methylobacter sp. S3L5C]|uniref:DUF2341 domain-containing protein n=1 Tax=Methylobacter sp. S3L5C TaxID=2839024 RepID=UPI001FADC1D6|nr:DUF2341 domain-containing protein [Methylobacter sp. S3L5C]UOA10214.1 DUF2341 domain-containing protein [Methylobacter sp. S3L5C]
MNLIFCYRYIRYSCLFLLLPVLLLWLGLHASAFSTTVIDTGKTGSYPVASPINSRSLASENALVSGNWLDPAWIDRSVVTINSSSAIELSNFQVQVKLDSTFDFSKVKSDGSDIRFTLGDGVTQIPFWIETWDVGNRKASLWIKVPTVPITGTTLYMYYGNLAATGASSGANTFEFFDDFNSGSTLLGYYNLGAPTTVLVQDQPWENGALDAPHTMSVIENNNGGYVYWGYYGLQKGCSGIGLAFSNDLVSWTKYDQNPLINTGRWPTVLKVGSIFYMLYTKDYCTSTPYIVLATSTDGINFADQKIIVQPQPGFKNQNPNLYFNPNDGNYYIYWFNYGGAPTDTIRTRSASTIEGLDNPASETIVLQSNDVLAAPNMMFRDGTYFLSTESLDANSAWITNIYSSTNPTSGFSLLPNNPILAQGSACLFQHIFGTELHEYYCKQDGGTGIWTLEHRLADLTLGRVQFQDGIDPGKWAVTGGSWAVINDTQQDGTVGGVLRGTIGSSMRQVLLSKYSGSDYVVEVYGKQLNGPVWGIGTRALDQNNLYSINLYENLDDTNNLYVYDWVNGGASTLNNIAVGAVNANAWYKLSVQMHGNAIDVYKDDSLTLQASSSLYTAGTIALYGEKNTVAEFNNVLVRKYAAVEPSTTVVSEMPLTLGSLQLNPNSVLGGDLSQGTVVLQRPAPIGGVIVTLSSSDPSVTIPSSVTVAANATSATFSVTTSAVSVVTPVTITGTYNGTQNATLTVNPAPVAFVKAAGNFGESVPYTVGIAPTPGNFLAVFVWQIEGAATPAVMTDNLGSIYTKDCDLTFNQGNGLRRLTVFHLLNAPGGITKVNITPNRPSRTIVAEYSGMPVSGAMFDVCGMVNNQTTASNTWSSLATTTTAVDLVFGLTDTGFSGNAGFGASGAWIGRLAQHDTIDADDSYLVDHINAAPGSYTATGTSTISLATSSVVVAFKTISSPAALASVTLNPASVPGGSSSTGTVALNAAAPSGGAMIALLSSDPSVTVPSNVTVGANATTATFGVTTTTVSAVTPVTITGTYNGTQTGTLTVNPLPAVALSSVSVNPSAVTGGISTTGTVTLTGTAPIGGIVVTLSNNNSIVSEPASVTVPAGASSATFTIATTPVASNTTVTLSAALNSITKTSTMVVNRPALASVSVNPASVKGGTSSTGTVTLTGAAPAAGTVVALSDNNTAASVPASVTVPMGATGATFTITTTRVNSSRNVTISGKLNGTTKTATLGITR